MSEQAARALVSALSYEQKLALSQLLDEIETERDRKAENDA